MHLLDLRKRMDKEIPKDVLSQAYSLMCAARAMSGIYEKNKEITSKYVHATSKGHEAIQKLLKKHQAK